MSIDRQYGKIVFICDDCEYEELSTLENAFDDALEVLKDNDWLVIREEGTGSGTGRKAQFRHICPKCQ